jgi:uncharacterized protein with GYD domain
VPTFISLMNWTEQGVKDYRETIHRAEMAEKAAEQLGGTVKGLYWTVGPYDVVAVGEFPDEETMTAFLLQLGAVGSLRTTTLRAFSRDEMRRIIDKAG